VYITTDLPHGVLTPVLFATDVDVIGTPYGDRIVGGPGAKPDGPEEIRGYGGNDRLDGGPGNDTVHGGPGDDVVNGGPGTDICTGGPGYDIVSGCEN
jgi:Ca2+-binding RTX toxin-like protein